MTVQVASLHLYPIKSLGGFAVDEAHLTDRGFLLDRRYMLVDESGVMVTQRETPVLACFAVTPRTDGFDVADRRTGSVLSLPWELSDGPSTSVRVWSETVEAREAAPGVHAWFSSTLGRPLRLVFMPHETRRPVDARYGAGMTSFADGFPYLFASLASLAEMNARIADPKARVGMDRFRPNVVIDGNAPFSEDTWREVRVGHARFQLVKPCARCIITTTNQHTGARGTEPLATLTSYRKTDRGVLFGQNAIALDGECVRVGDVVTAVA